MAGKNKFVYYFGAGKADGNGTMKNLLGGKGANLAEMTKLGIPVPAGFTISTEVCTHYYENKKKNPATLKAEVDAAMRKVEKAMGCGFGDAKNPLLVSVRSGARSSMPGMMETVLNVGLTSATMPGLIAKTGNERFVWDAYRRLITMYSDVVMEKAAGIEPADGKGIRHQLDHLLEGLKKSRGYSTDTQLTIAELKSLVGDYKERIRSVLGKPFPDNANEQLWGGLNAVFASWMGKRAKEYRRIERIPDEWGTAVNIQAMVFGNMGDTSATGVAFTRNPATGENVFYGEWLVNAQGEDVVAGIRTPNPLNTKTRTEGTMKLLSLEEAMPAAYKALLAIRARLEKHFHDMQDIEFTIQEGRLWMLQCRNGKRNGPAAVRMAVEMRKEKLIDADTALLRVGPSQLDELLHPMVDPKAEAATRAVASGLPAGPGGACGRIAFTAEAAELAAQSKGDPVILVRHETSPEDVAGMHAAAAILTAKGGMTSHAALVARGWGKCCVVGCSALDIDAAGKTLRVAGQTFREGDWLTINGTRGIVYGGRLALLEADPESNPWYRELMKLADARRDLKVRTNADSGADARKARQFGAQGIGLCRTEHMFFGAQRIRAMREMIVAENTSQRRAAVMKLLPFQRQDFAEIFEEMNGLPVTIRLLDPPLHEFTPGEPGQIEELAHEIGMTAAALRTRIAQLHELNPMLGHRGCRLGISYPEITEMQARAIFEAAALVAKKKIKVFPEVMVPLVGHINEFRHQAKIIRAVAESVIKETGVKLNYLVGTMIEVPRAALTAGDIAAEAEFFSFGTNDLTQTTFGFSRDDIGTFLPQYLDMKILPDDPFQTLDQTGVGQLLSMATANGRAARPGLKVGICGEHGGDPRSVEFCHRTGLDYVSCSPFRVPIARFAAAQAAIKTPRGGKKGGGKKAKGAGRMAGAGVAKVARVKAGAGKQAAVKKAGRK